MYYFNNLKKIDITANLYFSKVLPNSIEEEDNNGGALVYNWQCQEVHVRANVPAIGASTLGRQ